MCTFAVAFESESMSKEKHCDKVPFTEFAKIQNRRTGSNCFRLYVYAYYFSIPSGVRMYPKTRSC